MDTEQTIFEQTEFYMPDPIFILSSTSKAGTPKISYKFQCRSFRQETHLLVGHISSKHPVLESHATVPKAFSAFISHMGAILLLLIRGLSYPVLM